MIVVLSNPGIQFVCCHPFLVHFDPYVWIDSPTLNAQWLFKHSSISSVCIHSIGVVRSILDRDSNGLFCILFVLCHSPPPASTARNTPPPLHSTSVSTVPTLHLALASPHRLGSGTLRVTPTFVAMTASNEAKRDTVFHTPIGIRSLFHVVRCCATCRPHRSRPPPTRSICLQPSISLPMTAAASIVGPN